MSIREKGFHLSVVITLGLLIVFFVMTSINSVSITNDDNIISDTTLVYDRIDDGKYIYDSIVSVRINDWDNHMTVSYDIDNDFTLYYTDKPIFNKDTSMCQLYILKSYNSKLKVNYIIIDFKKNELYLVKTKKNYVTFFRKNYSEIKE